MLSDPTRVRLLWALLDGEMAVNDLADAVGKSCGTCTGNDVPAPCSVTTHGGRVRRHEAPASAARARAAASGVDASTSIAASTPTIVSSGTETWLPRQSQ